MFKTIVWATDGSAAADHAVPYLKQLASANGAQVVACHSVLALLGPGARGESVLPNEEEVEAKIKHQVNELVAEGIDARLEIVGGDTVRGAAHDIVRVADREDAGLIVAGTRGHTALGGLLLGSVTHRLLQIAGCPVLVVPIHTREALGGAEATAEETLA
jgi:nucleotide-binding universal stress UspA family protein